MKTQTFYRFFVSLILLIGMTACDARPKSQMDSGAARSVLDALTKDGPEVTGVSDALLVSAKQAEEKKDHARAAQFYGQLADKYPDNLEYQLRLADNLRRTTELEKSIIVYDRILQRNPRHVAALEGKGLALISKTNFAEASAPLEEVMKISNNRWRTLNGVGILFIAKGMPEEAVTYFDAALRKVPDHPTVLNNVGLTLALQGEHFRAAQALNRASSKVQVRSLQRQRIDLNLALVLSLAGDVKRAEQIASKHLSGEMLQNNMGLYAKLAGNDKLAKAYLNSALSGSSTFYEKAWKNLESVN